MTEAPQSFWIAEMEFRKANARGIGTTPEEAVKAIIDGWRQYASKADADPEYIIECREEITINRCDTGRGYVIGGSDFLWHDVCVSSMDERFDEIFNASPQQTPRSR